MNETNLTSQPSPNAQKKKVIIILVSIFVILIGISAFVYYQYTQKQTEQTAYAALFQSYRVKDYEDFLTAYPNSEYKKEIELRLADLRAKEEAWLQIANSTSVQDFVLFKNRFRDPRYDQLCDRKIDSLDWIKAQQTNTSEAYAMYLESHPMGNYTMLAKNALSLEEEKSIRLEEQQEVAMILQEFYTAFASQDPVTMCKYLTPVLDNFLNQRNATKGDVVKRVNQMFSPEIENCIFSINNDLKLEHIATTSGEKGYKATFSVDQYIQRTDAGKTFGSYMATVLLNEHKMITSIVMKEISKVDNTN